jgi:hypothetical protein
VLHASVSPSPSARSSPSRCCSCHDIATSHLEKTQQRNKKKIHIIACLRQPRTDLEEKKQPKKKKKKTWHEMKKIKTLIWNLEWGKM